MQVQKPVALSSIQFPTFYVSGGIVEDIDAGCTEDQDARIADRSSCIGDLGKSRYGSLAKDDAEFTPPKRGVVTLHKALFPHDVNSMFPSAPYRADTASRAWSSLVCFHELSLAGVPVKTVTVPRKGPAHAWERAHGVFRRGEQQELSTAAPGALFSDVVALNSAFNRIIASRSVNTVGFVAAFIPEMQRSKPVSAWHRAVSETLTRAGVHPSCTIVVAWFLHPSARNKGYEVAALQAEIAAARTPAVLHVAMLLPRASQAADFDGSIESQVSIARAAGFKLLEVRHAARDAPRADVLMHCDVWLRSCTA